VIDLISDRKIAASPSIAPLDLVKIFGRPAPLQVDLGCGDGSFLCQLAQANPRENFLGIERLAGRVATVTHKAKVLENVRALNAESAHAVRYLLPKESVETFYLLFPDPWPKRRHHRRRIVTAEFLDSIHRALANHGLLHIATDQFDYFEKIKSLARAISFDRIPTLDALKPSRFEMVAHNLGLPASKFELRFREQGAPIYRLALRKISPVR
jgi:tRNA (guanine-N7-)-methyltransferase